MAEYTVHIDGLDKLKRAFERFPTIARPRINQALRASVAELRKHTGRETVPWRTGALASTFSYQMGDGWARYYPTRHYAGYVEFGRGEVRPVKARALHWKNVVTGRYVTSRSGRSYYSGGSRNDVFSKYARPSKGRPYMQKIVDKSERGINAHFATALDRITSDIAKA